MRGLASFIMRGRRQALAVVLLMAAFGMVVPPLLLLSGAALALVALRRGASDGISILLAASAVMGVILILVPEMSPFLGLYLIGIWGSVTALGLVLRATVSLPRTVFGVVVLAEIYLIVGWLLIPGDPAQWWFDQIVTSLRQDELAGPEQWAQTEAFLREFAPKMTVMLAVGLSTLSLASLLIGRWWQALLYNPGGFRQEFHELRLGKAYGVIGAVAIVIGLLSPEGGAVQLQEMAVPVLMFASVQGLAIVHGVLGRLAVGGAAVPMAYAVMLFLTVFVQVPVLFVLAVLAIVDNWLDFRGRIPPRGAPPREPGDG